MIVGKRLSCNNHFFPEEMQQMYEEAQLKTIF